MIKLISLITLLFSCSYAILAQSFDKQMSQAAAFMEADKYQEAVDIYESILLTAPNNLQVLYNAAYSYLNIGRADMAHTYLRRFIMRNDKDADAYNLLGLASERSGYNGEALENYTKAISMDTNFYEAYFNRGRCYSFSQNFAAARADYNNAKKNKTIIPELYYSSGELYFHLEQYDSALIDLEKIQDFKTANYMYFAMLGDSYYSLWPNDTSKLSQAVAHYTKALQLHPEEVSVLKNRAFVYDKLEQYEKAEIDRDKIREIQIKIGLDPQSIDYKQMIQPDRHFSMLVPATWKALMNISPEVETILLYDSLLVKHDTIPEGYVFEHGCEIKFYKNLFRYDSNNINATIALRDAKFEEGLAERSKVQQESYINYSELSKKHFNPSQEIIKEVKKMSFNVTYSTIRFFRVEYLCVTTTGHMLHVSLWVPDKESIYYEALLDYIVGAIKIPT